jgi:hypothetical protein
MARILRPEPIGQYRYGVEALDGDMGELSFEEPVPAAYRLPLRNRRPREIFGGGARVSPVNMPTKLRLTRRKGRLIDFDNAGHMFMVTRRFLNLVENFQKDVQYFPIECFWSDDSFAGHYFLFFTTVLLDAVDREKTTATWTPTRPGEGIWQPRYDKGETFVFDKSRLGNTHMWVDPNMPTRGALITEELRGALEAAKIESMGYHTAFEEI